MVQCERASILGCKLEVPRVAKGRAAAGSPNGNPGQGRARQGTKTAKAALSGRT